MSIPRRIAQLVPGERGALLAVDEDGKPWQYDFVMRRWEPLPSLPDKEDP